MPEIKTLTNYGSNVKLTLGVVGKAGTGEVQGVDNSHGQRTSKATGGNVGGHFGGVGGVLGNIEEALDLALEGKVQGLGGEVPDDVSQVSTPERLDTLLSQSTSGAVDNTLVGLGQTTLLDHFVLVLDQKLDTLNGSSRSLKWTQSKPSFKVRTNQDLTLEIPAAMPESMKSSTKFNFPPMFTKL